MNFIELDNLPVHYDLLLQLDYLGLKWKSNQICINTVPGYQGTVPGKELQHLLGTGSLGANWDAKYIETDQFGNEKTVVPLYDERYEEEDFTVLCDCFKGTAFEIFTNN